jgi:large subunit ribosomal protein L24e
MVVNTELCSYSETKMWPGRGTRYVTKDGKTHTFSTRKCASLFRQGVKPVKLTWTQAWRKLNRKGKTETTSRKRLRRRRHIEKAIVGISLDDIKRRKEEKPEVRQAMRDQALKEIKDRQKKKTGDATRFEKKAAPKAPKSKPTKRR